MRLVALLLSSLLLSACANMVRSEAPWFGLADAAGAPPLRDGVWAAVDPDCRFDVDRPLEQWPGCAQGRVIRGGEELNLNSSGGEDGVRYGWSSEAFMLAGGGPRIHQRACGEPPGVKEAEEEDVVLEAGGESALSATAADTPAESSTVEEAVSRLIYCYAGLRADAVDAEGRIIAFTTWPIWCGPFPPRAEGEDGPNVTDAPFPGLTIMDEHCVADDLPALRAAATASEALRGPDAPASQLGLARFRWIRDGWR